MTKYCYSCLSACIFLNPGSNHFTNTAKLLRIVPFDVFTFYYQFPILGPGAFGNTNETEFFSSKFPFFNFVVNFLPGKGYFRNQYNIRSSCKTAIKRYPSGISAHYFNNNYTMM